MEPDLTMSSFHIHRKTKTLAEDDSTNDSGCSPQQIIYQTLSFAEKDVVNLYIYFVCKERIRRIER